MQVICDATQFNESQVSVPICSRHNMHLEQKFHCVYNAFMFQLTHLAIRYYTSTTFRVHSCVEKNNSYMRNFILFLVMLEHPWKHIQFVQIGQFDSWVFKLVLSTGFTLNKTEPSSSPGFQARLGNAAVCFLQDVKNGTFDFAFSGPYYYPKWLHFFFYIFPRFYI